MQERAEAHKEKIMRKRGEREVMTAAAASNQCPCLRTNKRGYEVTGGPAG